MYYTGSYCLHLFHKQMNPNNIITHFTFGDKILSNLIPLRFLILIDNEYR
jgi:hypothetical protein